MCFMLTMYRCKYTCLCMHMILCLHMHMRVYVYMLCRCMCKPRLPHLQTRVRESVSFSSLALL